MRLKQLVVALALCLVSAAAHAAWNVDPSSLRIPPPPNPGSAGDRRDFAILFQYQQNRTPDQCRAAEAQSSPSLQTFFGPSTTGVLSEEEVEHVSGFADEVARSVNKASTPFKRQWMRPRPYDENSDVHPCVRRPGGQTSYPSYHAALGVALGEALGEIFPAKRQLLHEAGLRVGENRVLGGVHHPTDVVAGQMLGGQIETALMNDPSFRAAIEELRGR